MCIRDRVYAVQLAKLGRWSDSSNVLKTLMAESPGLPACDRGTLLTNVAWVQLLARETDPLATDPAPALAESKAAFDDGCPEDRYGRVNLLINLALARLQA